MNHKNNRKFLKLTTGLIVIVLSCFSFAAQAANQIKLVCEFTLSKGEPISRIYDIDFDLSTVTIDGDTFTLTGRNERNGFILEVGEITENFIRFDMKHKTSGVIYTEYQINRITGAYYHKQYDVNTPARGQCHKSEGNKF